MATVGRGSCDFDNDANNVRPADMPPARVDIPHQAQGCVRF